PADGQSDAPRGRRSSRRGAEDSGSAAEGWSGANDGRPGDPVQDSGTTETPGAQRGRRFSRRAADSGGGSAGGGGGRSAGSGQEFGAPDGDWLSTLRGGQPAHGNDSSGADRPEPKRGRRARRRAADSGGSPDAGAAGSADAPGGRQPEDPAQDSGSPQA